MCHASMLKLKDTISCAGWIDGHSISADSRQLRCGVQGSRWPPSGIEPTP